MYAMQCRCATRVRTPFPLIMLTRGLVPPNIPSRQDDVHVGWAALFRSWDKGLVNPSHPAPGNSFLPRTTSLMNTIEFMTAVMLVV